MKKIDNFAILMTIVVILSVFSACDSSAANTPELSPEQIRNYRQEYPITGLNGDGAMDGIQPSMELAKGLASFWAQVKCVGQAEDIHVKGTAIDNDFYCYRMEVIKSFDGSLKAGDKFRLIVHYDDKSVAPDFLNGKTWIIGAMPTVFPQLSEEEKADLYTFYADLCFYVTDDGYVLSLSGSENKEHFSGISLTEWEKRFKEVEAAKVQ
ncbi:MAG: hypothetical protein IJM90_00835 [Firmicutes bacterium]|nr:hypothetical protein [Bacillota bacterium]